MTERIICPLNRDKVCPVECPAFRQNTFNQDRLQTRATSLSEEMFETQMKGLLDRASNHLKRSVQNAEMMIEANKRAGLHPPRTGQLHCFDQGNLVVPLDNS